MTWLLRINQFQLDIKIIWTRLIYGIEKYTFAGLPARLIVLRVAEFFKNIGLRYSKLN